MLCESHFRLHSWFAVTLYCVTAHISTVTLQITHLCYLRSVVISLAWASHPLTLTLQKQIFYNHHSGFFSNVPLNSVKCIMHTNILRQLILSFDIVMLNQGSLGYTIHVYLFLLYKTSTRDWILHVFRKSRFPTLHCLTCIVAVTNINQPTIGALV